MKKHVTGLRLATAVALLHAAAATAAPPAAPDPFARVPAFPTACYTQNDPFVARIEAAFSAAEAELYKQQATNNKIEEAFRNIDPMDKSTKMQDWMMNNPKEAMEYMQAVQTIGNQSQTVGPEFAAALAAFDNEREALPKRYLDAKALAHAPTDKRAAPIFAKFETLGFSESCRTPDWARADLHAIVKDRDVEYRTLCARWWSVTGPVQDYLKRYRAWLTTKYLPSGQKADELTLKQYAIMNMPAASWKSTVPLQKVVDYLGAARSLYSIRDEKPYWSEDCVR